MQPATAETIEATYLGSWAWVVAMTRLSSQSPIAGTLESVSMSHKECSAQAASRSTVAAGKSCFPRKAAATKNNSIANAV